MFIKLNPLSKVISVILYNYDKFLGKILGRKNKRRISNYYFLEVESEL
jgi:hypothetical protein